MCLNASLKGRLSAQLSSRILGQDSVVERFADAIERSESAGVREGRPKSFILLLGPTGTGKTEMVLQAARLLYGGSESLQRIDLGEFQHPDATLRLLGAPDRGSILGEALDALRDRGGFLLLDEIEKAHPSVITILLGFDAGGVALHDGRRCSLERVHVVMTSNLGSAEAVQMEAAPAASVERHILRVARRAFRPEIFARFQERLVFARLGPSVQRRIAALQMERELSWRSKDGLPLMRATTCAVTRVAELGCTRDLGARPLRDAVEREVGRALAAQVDLPRHEPRVIAAARHGGLEILPLSAIREFPLETMKPEHNEVGAGTLLDVAVLDVLKTPGLREELMQTFLRRCPEARSWPETGLDLVEFRTECRWARARSTDGRLFAVNELGGGEGTGVTSVHLCRISVYAELPGDLPAGSVSDDAPFIDIAFDDRQLDAVPVLGHQRLEHFLLRRLEGIEQVFDVWRSRLGAT